MVFAVESIGCCDVENAVMFFLVLLMLLLFIPVVGGIIVWNIKLFFGAVMFAAFGGKKIIFELLLLPIIFVVMLLLLYAGDGNAVGGFGIALHNNVFNRSVNFGILVYSSYRSLKTIRLIFLDWYLNLVCETFAREA
jgi:hypothetical protein